ncbi:MAG: M20/M25/M40 family metallo-hydrolase, partial [Sulfolobales archaeon]
GKAFGPGVLDMKGGIVVMIAALRALRDAGSRVLKDTSITIFLNSDEEILSPSSMHMIDAEASTSDLAVVFEPARPGGGYVRSRWGVARCLVKVYGRAGHAGWVSSGVAAGSAIHELVRRISEVLGYAEKRGDVLLNVGVVRGGERFNVVAPYAEAEIGVRSPSLESLKRAVSDMNNIFARVQDIEGVRTEFHVMSMWPPLIETERNRDALKHFERAANELGRSLGVEDTSGASDANHISQYTAVVDGAGAVGGNPHSPDEYIDIDRTLERAVITARALEIYYEHAKEMVRG